MLLHKMKELHSQGLFCDTTVFLTGGERLRAHSVILAAASPFFLSILRNPAAGLCLFLDQFNKQAVVPVLEFAYTGRVSVEMEELPVIQAVAESLGFFRLGKIAQNIIHQELNHRNRTCMPQSIGNEERKAVLTVQEITCATLQSTPKPCKLQERASISQMAKCQEFSPVVGVTWSMAAENSSCTEGNRTGDLQNYGQWDREPLVPVSSDSAKPTPEIRGSPASTTQTCSEAYGGTSKSNSQSSPVANCMATRDDTQATIPASVDESAPDADTISMPSHLNTSDSADNLNISFSNSCTSDVSSCDPQSMPFTSRTANTVNSDRHCAADSTLNPDGVRKFEHLESAAFTSSTSTNSNSVSEFDRGGPTHKSDGRDCHQNTSPFSCGKATQQTGSDNMRTLLRLLQEPVRFTPDYPSSSYGRKASSPHHFTVNANAARSSKSAPEKGRHATPGKDQPEGKNVMKGATMCYNREISESTSAATPLTSKHLSQLDIKPVVLLTRVDDPPALDLRTIFKILKGAVGRKKFLDNDKQFLITSGIQQTRKRGRPRRKRVIQMKTDTIG